MSAALVAVTVHVPTLAYERVVPDTEQPAVPALVNANVTAPPPDPPVVASAAKIFGNVTVSPVVKTASFLAGEEWVNV